MNGRRHDIEPAPQHREATHIVFLVEPKEPPNLGRPLGPQPLRMHHIRDSGEVILALLDDAERQHRKVHTDDAAAHRLPLALARSSWPVAAVAVGEEQADSRRMHDSLLHGKALLVVAACNAEDVAFEFIADAVAGDFLAHTTVHEDPEFAFVLNFDDFLSAIGGEGDVELHRASMGVVDGRR